MCNDDSASIPAFRVGYIPGKGRILVANRDIKPLETILTEAPAVIAPNLSSSPTVCIVCLKEGTEAVCRRCGLPVCGHICEESNSHDRECLILREIQLKKKNYAVVAVVRLLLLKNAGGENWRRIEKLMDHGNERKKSSEEWKLFQKNVVDPITALDDKMFDEEEIQRMIGILNVNCVSFNFRREKFEGRALYPTMSLISHSCVANAAYRVTGPDSFSVRVVARREILSGEEITIHYVPASLGQPARWVRLSSDWYFHCQCPRCLDVTEFGTFVSAIKCSQCREGLILAENSSQRQVWRCRFCNEPYDLDMIIEIIERVEKELEDISKNPSVKLYENFLRRHSPTLHIKHYLNLLAQKRIIGLLSDEIEAVQTKETNKKMTKYCKSFLSVMSRLDPGLSRWKGFVLRCNNVAQLTLLKIELEENKIDRNEFAQRSEKVWSSMKEVEECKML